MRNLAAEKEAVARLERTGFARAADGYEMRDARRIVRFFRFRFPGIAARVENLSRAASRESEPTNWNRSRR